MHVAALPAIIFMMGTRGRVANRDLNGLPLAFA